MALPCGMTNRPAIPTADIVVSRGPRGPLGPLGPRGPRGIRSTCGTRARHCTRRTPHHPPAPNDPHQRQLGFTLVEAVVAILLLSVGAIGLASTSAWSARLSADGRALQRQSQSVQYVADSLRTVPCAALSSSSATTAYGPVSWSVTRTSTVANVAITAPPAVRRSGAFSVPFIIPCE